MILVLSYLIMLGTAMAQDGMKGLRPPKGKRPIPGRGPCGGIDSEWNLNEKTGMCYQVVMKNMNWVNSALTCNSLGGSLANLKTHGDNSFVQNLVRSIKESIFSFGFWVGANDIDQAKNFFWMDGTKMNYTDWGKGEPNNWGGVEHCVQIKVADNLKWNDYICHMQLPFVCQKSGKKSIGKPKN